MKEALLAAWIISWYACVGVVVYELFKPQQEDMQVYLFVLAAFMLYYAIRVTRVFLWRRFGMEYLKIDDDALIYKRAIRHYGKAHVYHLENISNVGVITKEDGSIAKLLESSFWVIGGERVSFDCLGKNVRFGMQLDDKSAKEFARWLNDKIKKQLRTKEI